MPRDPNTEPYRWLSVPRWYLWEGGFLLTARAQGVVPAHAHHAIQIVIALDGRIAICGEDGEWRESRGIVVRPDVEHSFDCNGAMGTMVFVDPESREGAWLCGSLRDDITTVPDARLDSVVSELGAFLEQPDETADIGSLVRRSVNSLRPGAAAILACASLQPRIYSSLRMQAVIEQATSHDLPEIHTLLERVHLPLAGVDEHLPTMLVMREDGQIVGTAALELYADGALLRSVAVAPRRQGAQLGHQLTDAALQLAATRGADTVFLLTTTAERFFPRFGFEQIDREQVPASVRASVEFQSACPASAIVMRKHLR